MILIKLQGGLGNQMFQYAAARSLIKDQSAVYLDHSFLELNNTDKEHFTARRFELSIFKNIRALKAAKWKINFFKSRSAYFKLLRLLSKSPVKFIQQQDNEFVNMPALAQNADVYLDGYFQSEKHFKHIRKQLLDEFQFPQLDEVNEALKIKIINTPNAISIHIRRGDYLKSEKVLDVHGVLPSAYYQKALGILQSKYPSASLFVFTEDMEWAKANFSGLNTYFVEHNTAADGWKDMALISRCKHHIIANSSFSWWGAWLSQNNGDVFAPYNWFNPSKVNFNIQDFIPDSWTVLKYE